MSQDGTSFTDTFEDQSYAPAFRYTYRVSAFNVKGYSSEIIAYITTPGAPLAPNTVAAAGYSGPIRVKLTWKNSSNVQDTVEVERSVTGTGFAPLSAGLSGTATSYEDLSAAAGKTYYYRLRAHTTEGGYSNYSAVVSATTPRR